MVTKKVTEAVNTAEKAEAENPINEDGKNGATSGNAVEKQKDESVYTVNELAKAAETAFDKPYSPDIIRAAMKIAGKTQATRTEAAEIIKKFLGKDKEVAKK